jgi:multicomponent Na+:H+ antiporter subunit E
MEKRTRTEGSRITGFLFLFLLLAGVWLCLSSSLDTQELIAGAVVCVLAALVLHRSYAGLGLPPLSPKILVFGVVYLLVLAVEVAKANLDVAYRVIHPKMPIRPGIVVVKTDLKGDMAKMILANSITLTPGTFTVDVLGDRLLVHWIDVKSEDPEEARRLIAGRFERWLKRIFE